MLSKLVYLNLNNNKLTSVPRMTSLTGLTELDVASNRLAGTLPNEISKLTNLKVFNTQQNSLIGSLPAALGLLSQLASLHVETNLFTGSSDL